MVQVIKLIFSADNSGALKGINGLSAALQQSREDWKRSIYQEKARAAQAKTTIAEAVLAARKEEDAAKSTTRSKLNLLKAEEGLAAARGKAAIAQRQFDLRVKEQAESPGGLSGLERMSAMAGSMLPRQFQFLRTAADQALGGTLTKGVTAGSLAIGGMITAVGIGLVGAFMLAAKAVSFLTDEIGQGIQRQTEMIANAEPLKKAFGISYDEADKSVRDTQVRNARLGRDLPVSSMQITAISSGITDNLAGSLKAAGKGLDQLAGYQDFIASRAAIVAQIAGVDSKQANLVVNKLGSGASLSELGQLEILEKNPAFRSAIEDAMKEYGIKTTKDLPEAKKADFIKRVFDNAVSPEQIKRLQGTIAARISGFTDSLFDPYVGIFGVERDVDGNDANGVQSVMTSFSKTVELFFGDGGTLQKLGKTFEKLGIKMDDPMTMIVNGLNTLNGILDGLNKALEALNNGLDSAAKNIRENPISKAVVEGRAKVGEAAGISRSEQRAIDPGIRSRMEKMPGGSLAMWGTDRLADLLGIPKAGGTERLPLHQAISMEAANKPAGSDLVIANSSELIFKDLAQAERAIGGRSRGGGGLNIGGITIYQQPGEDAQGLADRVISEIDRRIAQTRGTMLSA